MSYAVSITQDGTRLETAGEYVDQDIVVGISDSIKKAAQTYNPSTEDQVIPAGKYLDGAQTIKGDANLIAANIRSGKSIFGVAGSLTPGITPSGTKNITANGTYDVTQFASAEVNIAEKTKEWVFNQVSDQHGSIVLLTADAWLAAHRADPTLMILVFPDFVLPDDKATLLPSIGTNFPTESIGSASPKYGFRGYRSAGSSGVTLLSGSNVYKLSDNASTSAGMLAIKPDGTLYFYGNSTYIMASGSYKIKATI